MGEEREDQIMGLLNCLSTAVVSYRLRALGHYVPAGAFASDLRGGLGKALHGSPHYQRLFESSLPQDQSGLGDLKGGSGAPRGYVCRVRRGATVAEGRYLALEIVLFGPERSDVRAWTDAVFAMASHGLGEHHTPFALDAFQVGPLQTLADKAQTRWDALAGTNDSAFLRVRARTPIRLYEGGEPTFATPGPLLGSILRRVDALARVHGTTPPDLFRRGLQDHASTLTQRSDYREAWEWTTAWRFSHRQQRAAPLDGCVGHWEASVPRWLGLALLAAEVCHAGKGTVHGLGEIEIDAGR